MKKFCSLAVIMILIFSSGCKKEINTNEKNVTSPSVYSSNIDITFGETEMKAKLTKHSSQKYEINMLSPEIMKPLALVYENGICNVSYDGLTFETDFNRFPQSKLGALLIQALSDSESGITTKSLSENGDIIIKGITDYGDFILIQNPENGLWKEFIIKNASIHIMFSDYIVK